MTPTILIPEELISGHGNANPTAFLISDAPQGQDLKTGYALTGYPQNILEGLCKDAGMRLHDLYRTTLVKSPSHPLSKKEEELETIKNLIPSYAHILKGEVNGLKPKLLVPLGELSFNYLTGLNNIRKFRGSVMLANPSIGFDYPVKVMPILGPYPFLYEDYKMNFISRLDFQKIPKYLNDLLPPDNLMRIWVARTASALRAFLERFYKDDGLLVFDIETFYGVPTCLSFCFDGFESVCIPLLDQSIDFDNRVLMAGLVARVLASPIRKVNQNIKFDWKTMWRWGFFVNNIVGDTMIAANVLMCEFPKNLGFLTSIYTDLPYFKDEGKEFDPEKYKKDQFYNYNAKDSLATWQIYEEQQKEIDVQGCRYVYDSLIKLMPIYRKMEDTGIRIDMEENRKLIAKYRSLFDIQLAKLRALTGRQYVNPNSPKQMAEVIFEDLGYEKLRGVKGTDEDSLKLLLAKGEAVRAPSTGPIVLKTLINCRKIHKVLETLELPMFPDGRFRCEFNLVGTETGRSSGSKCAEYIFIYDSEEKKLSKPNLGHSLQTIGKHGFAIDGITYGKDIRNQFVASRGKRFVEIDLSQAEARVDAVLAGNIDILSVFDGPIGIHRLTGSWAYGCDPADIKKNILIDGVDRYHVAKQVRHAGERNITPLGLITQLLQDMELPEAQRVLKVFHAKQPEIRDTFHKEVETAVKAHRLLVAPNGRRRDFFDRIDGSYINEAISFLPQAIVSDQTKFSLIETLALCPWADLLTEAHDGTLAEVEIGREMEYFEVYKRNIELPIDFRYCTLSRDYQLVIPCELSIGNSWGTLEEIKTK